MAYDVLRARSLDPQIETNKQMKKLQANIKKLIYPTNSLSYPCYFVCSLYEDDEETPLLGYSRSGASHFRKFLVALLPIGLEEWRQCGVLWKMFLICKVRPRKKRISLLLYFKDR